MRAATAAGTMALVLAALCGCGSSQRSGGGSTATGATGAERSTRAGGVQVNTTPKFASPAPGSAVRSGLVQVAMRNISLSPDAIRVKAGSRVRWTNYDNVQHNVTSVGGPQRLRSGNFGQGAAYEVQLTRPGVVHYLDTTYPATMNGTIEVV